MPLDVGVNLTGKVALVTGAGRGIGRGISHALAGSGAHVVLVARTARQLDRVAAEIVAAGGLATALAADVADEEAVKDLFLKVEERFGRLDVLVNNAGVGAFGPLSDIASAEIDRVLAVNVRGTFLCSREALRIMKRQGSGYLINLSSVVGVKGYPNQSVYTASKHAVMGLTKSLAAEIQEHGIRVSVILPGAVDTDMIAAARPDLDRSEMLQPEDIARAVLFLLSLPDRAAVDEIHIRRRTSAPF